MKPDIFTKIVLTVIALMLTVIAGKNVIKPETTASAQAGRAPKVTADNWDDENPGSSANVAKLSYVNKRCRMWAKGDIDIDQTCLVTTVRLMKESLLASAFPAET